MNKDLGIKRSLSLKLCRLFAILLTLSTAFMLLYSLTDFFGLKKLSDAKKEELRGKADFRVVVNLAFLCDQNPLKFGSLDEITSVEYLLLRGDGRIYACLEEKDGDMTYITVSGGYEIISAEKYRTEKSQNYGRSTEFDGMTLAYAKELAKSEDAQKLLRGWRLENLQRNETFVFAQEVIRGIYLSSSYGNVWQITRIYCQKVSSNPAVAYAKVEMASSAEPIYFWVTEDRAIEMDEWYPSSEATLYQGEDLELLISGE